MAEGKSTDNDTEKEVEPFCNFPETRAAVEELKQKYGSQEEE